MLGSIFNIPVGIALQNQARLQHELQMLLRGIVGIALQNQARLQQ